MALETLCGLPTRGKIRNSHPLNLGSGDQDLTEDFESLALNPEPVMKPPFDPVKLGEFLVDGQGPTSLKMDFLHGTTTLGFKYQGGVLLAVDSRATGGLYIGSGKVRKILEINQFLLGTMAGGAADCTFWERVLSRECRLFELRNKERISVAAASKILNNICFRYKGMGLSMGVMIAGYDKKGPGLYYVDSDGSRTDGNVFSVGSGSVYAYGVLDNGYRYDLTDEEAYDLGRRAIFHATFRDAASGGIIRVVHMTKDGFKYISEEDCQDLYYRYNEQK